ncbi:MAG: HD domain-containing protein, partial [Floccifex sp.]
LGHGPFSHMFESITQKKHENITMELILDEKTEVHQVLKKEHGDLPNLIVSILNHSHPNKMLSQMISSQLDADRMDYLLRDAYETGTSYGKFDLERILRTLRVKDGNLCVKESGMHSIEDYIMARYHMYWQVYLHPDAKSYEILIELFIKRYQKIRNQIKIQSLELLFEPLSSESFYLLDENRLFYSFQQALFCEDEELKDLANRILNRHLLSFKEDEELDGNHQYVYIEQQMEQDYLPYHENKDPIWILNRQNECIPLSKCSEIVKALLRMETNTKKRIFYN